jgi:cysteinyl-tRNA synthetase
MQSFRMNRERARVAQDDYSKENAQDFALWKAAKPEDEACGAAWDSPWGRGRPGWHLECSAMAMHELGPSLDIHCGGVDLIFPHHEDEIAQSEGATGVQFSRFWCHGAFLLTEGAKMAKRVGNVWTVSDLRGQKISAEALRYFVFSTHYRKELNLVREAIDASTVATRKLGTFRKRLGSLAGGPKDLGGIADKAESALRAALLDDLNAPEALAALFTFVRRANASLDSSATGGSAALERAREVLELFDLCLGVVDDSEAAASRMVLELRSAAGALLGTAELAFEGVDGSSLGAAEVEWLRERLGERLLARKGRDFARSDALRDEIHSRGHLVEDTTAVQLVRIRG